MKRVLSFIILSCLLMTQTFAATQNGLQTAFEDFKFALTVEWDQQDQQFYNQATKQFEEKVRALNPSMEDISQLVRSEVRDERAAQDIEQALLLVHSNQMTDAQALQVIQVVLAKSGSQGASFEFIFPGLSISLLGIYALITAFGYGSSITADAPQTFDIPCFNLSTRTVCQ